MPAEPHVGAPFESTSCCPISFGRKSRIDPHAPRISESHEPRRVSQAQSCGSPLSATYERVGSIKKFTSATICGRGESYLTTSRQSGFPVRRPGVHSVPMEVVNRTPARSRPPTSCCPCRPRSSRPSAKPSRRRSDAWVRRSWRYRRGRSRTPASRRYSLRG